MKDFKAGNNKDNPSEIGSNFSSSNGEGGGNNSDNSALISIGNASFGFNFDSEEGNNSSSSPNSSGNSEEGDSDQDGKPKSNGGTTTGKLEKQQQQRKHGELKPPESQQAHGGTPKPESATSDLPPLSRPSKPLTTTLSAGAAAAKISSDSSRATSNSNSSTRSSSHSDAAAAAVAYLQSIADASNKAATTVAEKKSLKRKAVSSSADNDSGGYNSDDDEGRSDRQADSFGVKEEGDESIMDDDGEDGSGDQGSGQKGSRKIKKLNDVKREERNAREKERSFRISRQINELRNLLSSGGVIVPKGTKSSVLTEAANYIRMLQQHQYRSEIDRHQLVQQIQMIGGGALGQEAATAVRHVAAQNGVWSLGNFGGVPPKSAMMYHQAGTNPTPGAESTSAEQTEGQDSQNSGVLPSKIEETDYRHVFNSCTVGMAIASMGGAFIDCNKLFCQLSNYSKQEVCAMTVFNLTARQDLQPAFDLISQMLSAPSDPTANSTSCVLRGSFKHRTDLGLNVTLIKGEEGVAKCFCVTLILSPSSPYDTSRPVPATIELVNMPTQILPLTKDPSQAGMHPAPAYTTG